MVEKKSIVLIRKIKFLRKKWKSSWYSWIIFLSSLIKNFQILSFSNLLFCAVGGGQISRGVDTPRKIHKIGGVIIECYCGLILFKTPKKMKVFALFGRKVIKWGEGHYKLILGVNKKIEKMENDPPPTIKHGRVSFCSKGQSSKLEKYKKISIS